MSEAAGAPNRAAITASLILAMLMNTLDSTIANVALPHIQGTLSAAQDEVVWVLTSYIVAAAMTTPLSGWMANRFGIKRVLMVTLAGFIISSMLCGLSASLPELVVFRVAQGAFGSFTLPLGQTVMFNINPPSRHAQAMSIWAMGAIMGPLLGPLVGGYITEVYSWRWCFFINLPLGSLALIGVWTFLPSERQANIRRFDFFGFGMLITAVGALQLLLDRGPGQDWFSSAEIWTELLVALMAFWMFLAHTLTTRTPFVDLAVIGNANLTSSATFIFVVQGVIFGSLALMPQLTQGLMGYPVMLSGMINAPRGLGMLIAMGLGPTLMRRIDARLLVLAGVCGTGTTLWHMARFDLSMGPWPLMSATFWQGLSQGLMFAPLTTLAFATLAPQLRAEGAALFNLIRSMGSSIGISALQAMAVFNTQAMHAAMAAQVTPSDPVFRWAIDGAFSPETLAGAQALNGEITRQATMVAFVDDFRLMFVLSILCTPLVLLLRTPKVRRKLDLKDAAAAD
jgi:DHA2 family multidrug resistance protein